MPSPLTLETVKVMIFAPATRAATASVMTCYYVRIPGYFRRRGHSHGRGQGRGRGHIRKPTLKLSSEIQKFRNSEIRGSSDALGFK